MHRIVSFVSIPPGVKIALLLVLIALVGATGGAWSDNHYAHLGRYISRVAAVNDELTERAAPLNRTFDPQKGERTALARKFRQYLQELSTPREMESLHDQTLRAYQDLIDLD